MRSRSYSNNSRVCRGSREMFERAFVENEEGSVEDD